ncbi:MAG: 23S rRNA (cytidine(2498)-2'-O)-methyltransferase RlmM [Sandaracinaceae bacterium]|nr:23S rRNA (cytidine(2498)-2'-O)-methyltransferase RlmM [Sandaracinaceae bacterium]
MRALGPKGEARALEAGLVESKGAPIADGKIDLTFARQGFPCLGVFEHHDLQALEGAIAERVKTAPAFTVQVWAPDSEPGNMRMPLCKRIQERLREALSERGDLPPFVEHPTQGDVELVSVVLREGGEWIWGAQRLAHALSRFPGGRARMRVPGAVSRAARKLEEAFAWLGVAPAAGERCVDLGAAPGGWSELLLRKGAWVVAVDPAKLSPSIQGHPRLVHHMMSAFRYVPDEPPVDWLFCDMAWRPLEVAQLIAKWGRRRWTRFVIANFKLPMRRKLENVYRIRALVEEGGFRYLRSRQLYHDRDEFTLLAIA